MKKYIYHTLIILFVSQYGFGQDDRAPLAEGWVKLTISLQDRIEVAQRLTKVLTKSKKMDKDLLQRVKVAGEELNKAMSKALNATHTLDSLSVRALELNDYHFSRALVRMMVGLEEDPTFKNREDVLTLTTQLEAAENKIAAEKRRFKQVCIENKRFDLIFQVTRDEAPMVTF